MTAPHFAFVGRAFLETAPAHLLDGLDEMMSAVPEAGEGKRILQERGHDLEVEYVRLFLNPVGAPCSPWQSAHEERGRMMGPAHSSALAWYAKYGASLRVESDPADHVGLLLMFYAHLLAAGAASTDIHAFSEQHLTWVPRFAGSVSRETRHPFYKWLSAWVADLTATALSPQ